MPLHLIKLAPIQSQQDSISLLTQKIVSIKNQFDSLQNNLNTINTHIDSIEKRLTLQEVKQEFFLNTLSGQTSIFILFVTIIVALAGFINWGAIQLYLKKQIKSLRDELVPQQNKLDKDFQNALQNINRAQYENMRTRFITAERLSTTQFLFGLRASDFALTNLNKINGYELSLLSLLLDIVSDKDFKNLNSKFSDEVDEMLGNITKWKPKIDKKIHEDEDMVYVLGKNATEEILNQTYSSYAHSTAKKILHLTRTIRYSKDESPNPPPQN